MKYNTLNYSYTFIMSFLKSYNPANGRLIGETRTSTKRDIDRAVAKAQKAFAGWKKTPLNQRAGYLKKYRQLLEKHKEELARLVSQEMGKPISQSRDDIKYEKDFIDYYIQEGPKALADEFLKKENNTEFTIRFEPYGVCVCIAPWNFPLSMFNSGVLPALMAGNTVIFKPSEYTTLSQKRFGELLQQTGLPTGIFQLAIGAGDVGKMLIDHPDINLVWFTGSTKVGQEIFAKCGKKFIKGIMELGGSSPGIVFADADFEDTIKQLYWARFLNCGQVCSSVKRLFVERPIFRQVVDRLVKELQTKKVGDPLQKDTDFGPLVSQKQLLLLESQVNDAIKKGAKVEIGAKRPTGKKFAKGNYYLPTILTNVNWQMRVLTEETFGPVLPVIPFKTEGEVIEMANNTPYGLSAEIYTSDLKKAEKIASAIQSGVVGINTDSFYYPFCPIGGMKKSGMGREYGKIGFQEFAQIKLLATRTVKIQQ
ncbi:hypothetical protein A3F03_03155 [Candidatus Roizmanbacteria bacterium RIFCSPHIGHO2_12_FULL_41_11]|uniref:Aldehyde dehydrogenase n=2 Tax=Candidatus Roizmaniibacteriota TaxID=1752723 RepID=A0A1F7I638_9BACT|nr:MAG: hypothetical protein A3F03_03155 [Candidatus Roizmanbacteria bacterium RIFCSPHIGHO2_12_FULL_41_11]